VSPDLFAGAKKRALKNAPGGGGDGDIGVVARLAALLVALIHIFEWR
jgi:hypothetical protein